jgi:putative transposase
VGSGAPDPGDGALPRTGDLAGAAVRRLLVLRAAGELTTAHVVLAAGSLQVSARSVWRWLGQAVDDGQGGPLVVRRARASFEVDQHLRRRLAYLRGNVAAVHRELLEAAAAGGPPAPSLATLHRAVDRVLTPGDRAGLRRGEGARRQYDVFLQRPATHRNAVWEGDHVEAPVEVDVAGRLVKPWVTWFIDVATNVIAGVAVTAGPASRESILATLRAAITGGEGASRQLTTSQQCPPGSQRGVDGWCSDRNRGLPPTAHDADEGCRAVWISDSRRSSRVATSVARPR